MMWSALTGRTCESGATPVDHGSVLPEIESQDTAHFGAGYRARPICLPGLKHAAAFGFRCLTVRMELDVLRARHNLRTEDKR
jgi:hypothetical protein